MRNVFRAALWRWPVVAGFLAATIAAGLLLFPGRPLSFTARARLVLRDRALSLLTSDEPGPLPFGSGVDGAEFLRGAGSGTDALRVRWEEATSTLHLSYTASLPGHAADGANALGKAFQEGWIRRRREQASQILEMMDKAIQDCAREEAALEKAGGTGAPPPESLIAALEAEIDRGRTEVRSLSGEIDLLTRRIGEGQADAVPLQKVLQEVREKTSQRDELRRILAADDEDLSKLKTERAAAPGLAPGTIEARRSALERARERLEARRARLFPLRDPLLDPVERFEPARAASLTGAALPILAGIGLILGLLAARLVESLAVTIRSEHDIGRYVNLPLLGRVPLVRSREVRADAGGPVAEAYETMSALLEGKAREENAKSFAVTSTEAGEGKSTVTFNLAVFLARAGRRVLIVDADLRRPRQHRLFGLDPRLGLSSYLQGEAETVESVTVPTVQENLFLLPAGPAMQTPSLYLRSERFKEAVRSLREAYDFVLLDVPPAGGAADPLLVAPLADGTILVIAASAARKDDVTAAKGLLRAAGARLAGCVLNKSVLRSRGYYDYSFQAAVADTES